MRGVIAACVLACAACGRLGFDDQAVVDRPDAAGSNVVAAPDSGTPDGVAVVDAAFPTPTVEGLWAYWTFDEPGGADATGNGNQANCRDGSACPTQVAGVRGNAAAFDGATECFTVPAMQSWNAPAFTVSAWIDTPTMAAKGNGSVFVHESSNGCPSPELQVGSGEAGIVQLNTSDNTHNVAFTPTAMLSANQWAHVAITWDGTTQAVYVDGVCDCSRKPQLQPLDNPAELTIGCYPDTGSTYTGFIDELRVYDRVLSSAEIGQLYSYASHTAVVPRSCSETCDVVPPAAP